MNIPLVDLKSQYLTIKPEIDAALRRVIENTSFILGKEVADFENAFARYIGATGAVGVASGTAAIHLALLAVGVSSGDEVITTAHTFIATAEPILLIGAKPVFVDISPETYNLDPNQVEDAISARTKAILPVHLYGLPAEMDSLMDIAKRHNLWLIEDAAQAHGAEYKGRRCGSIGHLACFSFYPGKNLGAYGDGGAVTGHDEALLGKIRKLRDHGRSTKYEHEQIGFGERLDALQAAILMAKLPHLEAWVEARRAHARLYAKLLVDCNIEAPKETSYMRHAYHLYVIRSAHRDTLQTQCKSKGIGVGIHYPVPLHKQPAFMKLGYGDIKLPVTEKAAREILSLPMYPELTEDQIIYIADAIKEAAGR